MTKNPSISKAVEKLGGQTATARIVGASGYQVIQQWISAGRVPAKYCMKLSEESGVSVYELRPDDAKDIWPHTKEARHA